MISYIVRFMFAGASEGRCGQICADSEGQQVFIEDKTKVWKKTVKLSLRCLPAVPQALCGNPGLPPADFFHELLCAKMNMISKWSERSGAFLASPVSAYFCILLFFVFKTSHLSIPYYWDELGVYAKASLYMYDNSLAVLPGVIPDELSRGHPLLCAALFGLFFKLLGAHVWVGHLAALLFSCTLLYTVYQHGRKIYCYSVGLIACLLVMLQSVFIAQSSMVLPEILLAVFCTAAIFFYIDKRLVLFAVFSSLAMMTKETAIALPVTLWFVEICQVVLKKKVTADNVRAILAGLVPLALWGGFLVLQKQAHGWYFFPLHADYVSFSAAQIFSRFCYYVSFMLKGQGRLLWTIILALAMLVLLFRQKKDLRAGVRHELRAMITEKKAIFVLGSFIAWGVIVSMLNFHLARYILFILPSLALIVAQSFFYILDETHAFFVRFAAVLLLLITPLAYYSADVFNFDADMGFHHVVTVQKRASQYLDAHLHDNGVVMSSFPVNVGLMEPRAGYSDKKYRHIDGGCATPENVKADIYIYSFPGNLEYCTPKTDNLMLLQNFKSSFARVLIYSPKNKS